MVPHYRYYLALRLVCIQNNIDHFQGCRLYQNAMALCQQRDDAYDILQLSLDFGGV
ncbi:MAG: hypothetical protein ACJA0N_001060 [Pseudohongiellaceae bacterium]